MTGTLFCFGLGYVAHEVERRFNGKVIGTHREQRGDNFVFSAEHELNAEALAALQNASAVLISIPPDENGDPVFRRYGEMIAALPNVKWVGYLSTTGVYGDCDGAWVDENTPANPQTARSKARLLAENQWLESGASAHVFRLSGIYGPGRNALQRARENAIPIEHPGHLMNRIHVTDIARILNASINAPTPKQIYNLSDEEPADSADVLLFAYELLEKTPPRAVKFAKAELSQMAREFYSESKRVNGDKIKSALDITLKYPTYREGLMSCLEQEEAGL